MNHQLNSREARFLWFRGGAWILSESTQANGRRYDAAVKIQARLPDKERLFYFPLDEAPADLYLRFARLANGIWSEDYRIGSLFAPEAIRDVWPSVEAFLVEYGPPVDDKMNNGFGNNGLDVSVILRQAASMAIAVKCHQLLNDDSARVKTQLRGLWQKQDKREAIGTSKVIEGEVVALPVTSKPDLFDDSTLKQEAVDYIDGSLNAPDYGLPTIKVTEDFDIDRGWFATYKPSSLLGFMWLQFRTLLESGDGVKECIGCGITFEQRRSNQLYHDTLCRSQVNSKNTYARKKVKAN